MKTIINEREYSTFDAKCLGYKHVGEYGHNDGFEEQLFVAEDGQYFLFGAGGPESAYVEPEIVLLTKVEAESWLKAFHPKKASTK
jgi:hypothetical protein